MYFKLVIFADSIILSKRFEIIKEHEQIIIRHTYFKMFRMLTYIIKLNTFKNCINVALDGKHEPFDKLEVCQESTTPIIAITSKLFVF